jgi:AraC-like DNA-binding protein
MLTTETAIRLIVIGQEFLIAAIFLFGNGTRAARISGAALMLSVAGYLYGSDTSLRGAIPELLPAVILMAMIVPYCLWAFARAVFESPWPKWWVTSAFLSVGVVVWAIFVAGEYGRSNWANSANVVMHVVSLTIVLHALWLTAKGRPDDLIEHRRTLRLYFIVVVAAQALLVLIVELALGTTAPPAWLEFGNVIIIAMLTIGLAIPMLRLNPEFFEPQEEAESQVVTAKRSAISAADNILRQKLLDLMDSGYHQETGLTIRMLAEKLNHPEHQLRRLINGHLGYRNFSAFLNSYRIEAAKRQLTDPARVRIPVLTIALELGYASLGPFNRAFKAATGTTPSDYRQQNLDQSSANSE